MNVLFTICGRAGSKGAKNKNIRDFVGNPLPFYTLSAIDLYLKKNGACYERADIVVSSDSETLLEMFRNRRRQVFLINRDRKLANDVVRKHPDVTRNCMRVMEERLKIHYDIVIDLDITSPLRRVADIENVVKKRFQVDTDVVCTVTEARRNPYFNMVAKQGESFSTVLPCSYTSRQQAPVVYDMNASIYAFNNEFIHSEKPVFVTADIVLMKNTGFLDIDSDWDFEMMEVVARYLYQNDKEYAEIAQNIENLI